MNDITNIAAAFAAGVVISVLVLIGLAMWWPMIEYSLQWWVRWGL